MLVGLGECGDAEEGRRLVESRNMHMQIIFHLRVDPLLECFQQTLAQLSRVASLD